MAGKVSGKGQEASRGGFFAVQRTAWDTLCRTGSMNEAVAYLVLARGSNFGTRTSAWSVDAVERYTGIARARAKIAVHGLLDAGAVVQRRGGTKPLYYLPTAAATARMYRPGKSLSAAERAVFQKAEAAKAGVVFSGGIGAADEEARIAAALDERGVLLRLDGDEYVTDPDLTVVPASEWIWLPNTLVDGVDGVGGRDSPVEQVRQTQDLLTLHLFVDLYFWQSLAFNGGLHWEMMHEEFEKIRLGQQGQYDVWGFRPLGGTVSMTAPFVEPHLTGEMGTVTGRDGATFEEDTGFGAIRKALANLRALGLMQVVPHLIESAAVEAEVIHPCPVAGGEERERAITVAALSAAGRLLTDGQVRRAEEKGVVLAIPVLRHRDQAKVVGLVRMTHRAHTSATADWMGNAPDWAKWVASYNQIAPL